MQHEKKRSLILPCVTAIGSRSAGSSTTECHASFILLWCREKGSTCFLAGWQPFTVGAEEAGKEFFSVVFVHLTENAPPNSTDEILDTSYLYKIYYTV